MKKLFILISLAFLISANGLAQHSKNHEHSDHLETLLSEYLDMKEALVNGNFEGAKSSLQNFAEEVTSSNEMNHHPEHANMHQAHHSAMLSAVESALNAKNIDQLRNSFDEISAELIKAVKIRGLTPICIFSSARWLIMVMERNGLVKRTRSKIHITER